MPWDAGGVPRELAKYLAGASGGGRVLIPGCGAAYEVVGSGGRSCNHTLS